MPKLKKLVQQIRMESNVYSQRRDVEIFIVQILHTQIMMIVLILIPNALLMDLLAFLNLSVIQKFKVVVI